MAIRSSLARTGSTAKASPRHTAASLRRHSVRCSAALDTRTRQAPPTPSWGPFSPAQRQEYSNNIVPVGSLNASAVPPAEDALKQQLLRAVNLSKRGALASRDLRGEVEELQVAMESRQGAQDLDYELLGGMWELKWTTSEEVIPIINWDNIMSGWWGKGPLRAGRIFQRFTVPQDGFGQVDNVILFTLPLLDEKQGVRLTVNCDYRVCSGHMIGLEFNAANFTDIRISEQLEALLAPAVLPRLPLQAELLSAIRDFKLRLPFRDLAEISGSILQQVGREHHLGTAAGPYQLTYLDKDMLIGRAVTLGSSFIFTRTEEL